MPTPVRVLLFIQAIFAEALRADLSGCYMWHAHSVLGQLSTPITPANARRLLTNTNVPRALTATQRLINEVNNLTATTNVERLLLRVLRDRAMNHSTPFIARFETYKTLCVAAVAALDTAGDSIDSNEVLAILHPANKVMMQIAQMRTAQLYPGGYERFIPNLGKLLMRAPAGVSAADHVANTHMMLDALDAWTN